MLTDETRELLRSEMNKIRSEANLLDGRVEGFIDREKQVSYTMSLFTNQAKQDLESSRQRYAASINTWVNSSDNRARMVVVEATTNLSISDIAKVVFNASPLERVVVVGLDDLKQANLAEALRALWKERLAASAANEAEFKIKYKKESDSNKSIDELLADRSLSELLGPHLFKSDIDISYDSMQQDFPNFDVNIEEVFCFGASNALADNLAELGQRIQSGVPVFSVKSDAFQESNHGLWKCASKDPKVFLKEIASGKSAPELIGEKNELGDYENIVISPTYIAAFDLEQMKQQGFTGLDALATEDVDFFKKILFEEALYPANISPEAITKTISKATSILAAIKATVVSQALKWNMVKRPVSSAVEVEFAIGGMTLDGGNDIIKENLDKKNSYKLFFEDLLHTLVEDDIDKEEAIKIAFAQTLGAYSAIDKGNEVIKELVNGSEGAEAWRDLGLESTNTVNRVNSWGIKLLKPLMPIFLIGEAIGIVGLALTVVGIPGAVALALGSVSVGCIGGGGIFTAASMYFQIKANRKHLPRANMALAEANAKMYAAQREREAQIASKLSNIKRKIEDNQIADLLITQSSEISLNGARENQASNDFQLMKQKKSSKGIMLTKLSDITGDSQINSDGRVNKGTIDRKAQVEYTMNLFINQANKTRLSTENDYNRDINAWINSASNRARLVIIEAKKPLKIKDIAKAVFNASPLERIVVAGVYDKQERKLANELRKLWKKKLEDPVIGSQFKEKFGKQGDQHKSIRDLLGEMSLSELLGPHLFKSNLDTSSKTMQKEFPHFDVNIAEILCFGSSPALVKNLGELGQKSTPKIPIFSVKSDEFHEGDHGLWKCACNNTQEFFKEITAGKSASELIGEEIEQTGEENQINGETKYKNITISPEFTEMFRLSSCRDVMKTYGYCSHNEIEQEDLDFFKKIFFKEALYPADTSPIAINKTISKTTSALGASAGRDVANALKWNLVGRPASTGVEVDYAIGFMTLDGGNDIVKEDLDKKNSYKSFFQNLRDGLIQKDVDEMEATKIAFSETLQTYCAIEKNNEVIEELVRSDNGAENWRELGLEATNSARNITSKGVKALGPLIGFFLVGSVLGIGGLALIISGVGIPLAFGIGLGVIGFGGSLTAFLLRGYSTIKLTKANKEYLPESNFCFAQANQKMYAAQRTRVAECAKRLDNAKERLGIKDALHPNVLRNEVKDKYKENKNYCRDAAVYVTERLPKKAKVKMPADELNYDMDRLFNEYLKHKEEQKSTDESRHGVKILQESKNKNRVIATRNIGNSVHSTLSTLTNVEIQNYSEKSSEITPIVPHDMNLDAIPSPLMIKAEFHTDLKDDRRVTLDMGGFVEFVNRSTHTPSAAQARELRKARIKKINNVRG